MINPFENMTKEEFNFLIEFGVRNNILFGMEVPMLIYMPYGFVKIELPEYLSTANVYEIINRIAKLQNIEETETDTKELIAFILWIKDEFEAIRKLESEHLSGSPDPDMLAAGVQELNELGEINVIDSLAGGDILKWEAIEMLPYYKVFDKLKKNMIENKVNKAYHKIIASKKKQIMTYIPKPPTDPIENKYLFMVRTEEGKTILSIKEFDFDKMIFIDYETEIKLSYEDKCEQESLNESALEFLAEIVKGIKIKRLNNLKK